MPRFLAVQLVALNLAVLVLAPSNSARAQEGGVFPNPPQVSVLENGLTVVTVLTDADGIAAYYTLVRVGSRDEVEPGHSGYAHLFEHMMFRGTEAYPQARYEALIQSFGADNNAYTTGDFTLYTVTTPSSALARVVEVEADRFQNLSYDEAAYRTETGAVRGEYDTHASSPFLRMWETLSELAFSRHTYGHTTMGYLRDIDAMPEEVDYSRHFFTRFYTPDNCTVIVAGDVDHEAMVQAVRERYGAWVGHRDRPSIPTEPEPQTGASRHIDWPSPAAPRAFVGWRTPAFVTGRNASQRAAVLRETAALRVVHGLAFSDVSPLYQRLVVDERSLLELGSWAGDYSRDPRLFVAQATLAEGAALDEVLTAMQGALDSIAAGEASATQIEAVKSHVRYSMLGDVETPSQVADLVARFMAVGSDVGTLERYLAALAEVTPEDVARVAREYLGEGRRFVVTLSHGDGSTAVEEAGQ